MSKLWDNVPTRTGLLALAAFTGWLANDYFSTRADMREVMRTVGRVEGRIAGWDAIDRTLLGMIEDLQALHPRE